MSILGVALVLFLLGILGWIVINASKLEGFFKGNVQVNAFIREGSRTAEMEALKSYILSKPYARRVEYVSKDMARKKFIGEGSEDWNKVLDYNPLPASVDFYLDPDYVNPDSLGVIVSDIQGRFFIVSEVKYPDAVVSSLDAIVRKIAIILLSISAGLCLIAIILIDNTIKLAMFSNRFLIKTMQMVGATRWFISRPFDKRAVINGLVSSGLAITGILAIIYLVEGWWLPELRVLRDTGMLLVLCLVLVAIGIGITFISTHRSVTKYLRMRLDDLY
jgi:cell division transport system permease protein